MTHINTSNSNATYARNTLIRKLSQIIGDVEQLSTMSLYQSQYLHLEEAVPNATTDMSHDILQHRTNELLNQTATVLQRHMMLIINAPERSDSGLDVTT